MSKSPEKKEEKKERKREKEKKGILVEDSAHGNSRVIIEPSTKSTIERSWPVVLTKSSAMTLQSTE